MARPGSSASTEKPCAPGTPEGRNSEADADAAAAGNSAVAIRIVRFCVGRDVRSKGASESCASAWPDSFADFAARSFCGGVPHSASTS